MLFSKLIFYLILSSLYPKGPAGHVNHGDVLADGAAHHALAVMHHVADQSNLYEGVKDPKEETKNSHKDKGQYGGKRVTKEKNDFVLLA